MDTNMLELVATVIVALITAVVGPVLIEFVKSKLENNKKDEEDIVKNELEISCVIMDELEEIREKLNADRVWISVIHNGGHFLHSNKSIQKFSVMYETQKIGVSAIGMVFKNIPISLFSRSVEQQLKGNIIYIPNIDDPTVATYGLKSGMESVGTKATISKGLFEITSDQLIGSIGVDYLSPKNLTKNEIDYFKLRGERMSGFISTFIKTI